MRTIVAGWTLLAAAACGTGPAARAADSDQQFRSPSGNIACDMGFDNDNQVAVACDIGDHTYAAPPNPTNCHLGWGDRFGLTQGGVAGLHCHGDTLRIPGLPTLDYSRSRSVGPITCTDQMSEMTCTDSSTSHFFRVGPDSYQLG